MQDFRNFINTVVDQPLPIPHYIAKCIVDALNKPQNDPQGYIIGAGKVRLDLDEHGSYNSPKKSFNVQDKNGVFYEVTVTPINP